MKKYLLKNKNNNFTLIGITKKVIFNQLLGTYLLNI